ncbi:MAG: UbiA family prenyltransferase [Deltaproteobacteria bacterium]|nr:UbiA family prenyltransferase [Deltaproteobacteria bacterium]
MTLAVALRLGRVSNLPTVWTNVLAAAALAGVSLASPALGAVVLACSVFYVGGMFLNDAFDRESDARERPERPIPAGLVPAHEVFGAGYGLLATGLAIIAVTGTAALGTALPGVAAAVALAAGIVLYDVRHKGNPLAPLLMGVCRVLVYVTTAATLTGTVGVAVVGWAVVLFAYLVGLTAVARHATLGARPGLVARLIAGIALVDGLAIAGTGQLGAAAACVVAFGLTLALQRWVSGT